MVTRRTKGDRLQGIRTGRRAVLVACALLAGAPLAATADEAGFEGRILDEVEVRALSNGARVSVRFACPIRYAGHFPSTALTELRISLTSGPDCGPVDPAGYGLRAAPDNPAGLADVRLEPAGSALVLTLGFVRLVDVAVRPSPDFMGIDIAVVSGSSVSRTTPGVRRTPDPGIVEPAKPKPPWPAPTRTLPSEAVLEKQWAEARAAFDGGDYPGAVRLLTRMIEYPEHVHRAEAQELLGLARERNGQLAHAKAEYEAYLLRYPDEAAVGRVRQRLAALVTLDARPQVEAVARAGDGGMQWTAFGGFAQDYRRDATSWESGDFSADFLSQSMVITDGDLVLRGRGERFDVETRLNAGYMYDMLEEGPGDQTRISLAYADLADRRYALSARLGRQSRHAGGVLGTFDGLYLGWQANDAWRLNLMSGFPVDSTRKGFSSDRQFVSLSANWTGWVDGLEISPFLIHQRYEGLDDRQAVGGQVRWYAPGRTIVGLLDYDVDYGALNMALLLGTFQLPGRWTVTGTLDHRKSPFLTTRNALAGQPVRSLAELVTVYGEEGVRDLAADRTAQSDTVSLGVSRPLGERFQWTVDVSGSQVSGMPASAGVPEIQGSGTQLSLGAQLIGSSLLRAGDMSILGLRRYQSARTTTTSLSLSSRFPLWGGLRIAPRLRLDQREYAADASSQWLAGPSLRLDWHRRRTTVEFEAGGEFSSRDRPLDEEKTSRYWLSLGYRVGF